MVLLIGGASHTGKTMLAQKLIERHHFPCLSLDLLKMGLIRSGQTDLTPMDDEKLTAYLWTITREIVKTAVENEQDLIVEGCYIPCGWAEDLEPGYLAHVRCRFLIMTERYIRSHYAEIMGYADVVERRGDDSDCTMEWLLCDNRRVMEQCRLHLAEMLLIDEIYDVDWVL